MGAAANLQRVLENERQVLEVNERLKALIFEKEDDRLRSVEDEVQGRVRSIAELLNSEIQDLRAQLATNDKRAQTALAEAHRLSQSTEDNLNNEIRDLKAQLASNDTQAEQKLNNEIRNLRAELVKNDEQGELKIRRLEQELLATKRDRDSINRELELTQRNLAQSHDDHDKVRKLEATVAKQYDKINGLEPEVQRLKRVELDQSVQLKTRDRELEGARLGMKKANSEKDQLQATLDGFVKNAERTAVDLNKALAQAQLDFDREKRVRRNLKARNAVLKQKISDLEAEVEELSNECKKLKTAKRKSSRR
ncbi:hypothetical protein BDV12DRAFT_204568 [Aspergillus spectabilis]